MSSKEFSLRKSFNKHMRKLSSSGSNGDGSNNEFQPILMNEDNDFVGHDRDDHADHCPYDVALNVDTGKAFTTHGERMRGFSYEFWRNHMDHGLLNDPPSELIGKFLENKKRFGEPLDIDLEMNDLRRDSDDSAVKDSQCKEVRVSFQTSQDNNEITSHSRSTYSSSSSSYEDVMEEAKSSLQERNSRLLSGARREINPSDRSGAEVLKCTSIAMARRQMSLMRSKTRSRLSDPPEKEFEMMEERYPPPRASGILKSSNMMVSSPFKSGGLPITLTEDEEEDPFAEEDLPNDFKKTRLSFVGVFEWVSLCLIVAALICSLTISQIKEKKLKGLKIWKWLVLFAVLICGRLVSGWGIRVIVFFIERNFLLRKRVLYFVYGVRRAVRNCIWLALVLVAWHLLFDEKVSEKNEFLKNVTMILICLLMAATLWLIKTLIVKVLASSFHMSTYFERIQEALFNQFVIETLSGPPLIAIQRSKEAEKSMADEMERISKAGISIPHDLISAVSPQVKSGRIIGTTLPPTKSGRIIAGLPPTKSGRIIGSGSLKKNALGKSGKLPSTKLGDGITIDHLHKLNHNNVSAWNMKRLVNMVRYGALTTLDEQILGATELDESATEIRSEREAKAAAKKIFRNVAKSNPKYLTMEDLLCFMREDEALKTMSLFEGATEQKKISRSCLKNWVVNVFRERRALALTLDDTKTAVNKLHKMVNGLVCILIFVLSLLILKIATKELLYVVSNQVLLVAFVFGNTCKTIFESIIFLFVLHPYDVGDRCEVDGVQLIVEEMNILTTVFLRFDNQKVVFPNSSLLTKPIGNYYRSPDMIDAIEFYVHVHTPAENIVLIKQKIISYIENKKEHWYPEPLVVFKEMDALNMVRIAVWPRHRMNFQDIGEKFNRRSLLIEEMIKIFKELDIYYRMLPRDINVKTLP